MAQKKSVVQRFQGWFVSLPDHLKAGIAGVLMFVVSMLITNLVLLVPFLAFLIPFQMPLALALSVVVIEAIEKAVPDAYGPIAVKVLELVLLVLSAFGWGTQLAAMGKLPAFLS